MREALRARRHAANPVTRYGVRSLSAAYRLALLCAGAEGRSTLRVWLSHPRALHQTSVLTWADRYPGIFAACQKYTEDGPARRILSFGCSTGEEVLTLRRYFPLATIIGAELNRRSLASCRRLTVDDRTVFVRSDLGTLCRHGPYDIIFCMAVLQRTPVGIAARGTTNLRWIYPFEKFNRQVGHLDGLLKVGGLLVVHNTQYVFADTSAACRYSPLLAAGQDVDAVVKFDRNSRRLATAPFAGSIFVKVAA